MPPSLRGRAGAVELNFIGLHLGSFTSQKYNSWPTRPRKEHPQFNDRNKLGKYSIDTSLSIVSLLSFSELAYERTKANGAREIYAGPGVWSLPGGP